MASFTVHYNPCYGSSVQTQENTKAYEPGRRGKGQDRVNAVPCGRGPCSKTASTSNGTFAIQLEKHHLTFRLDTSSCTGENLSYFWITIQVRQRSHYIWWQKAALLESFELGREGKYNESMATPQETAPTFSIQIPTVWFLWNGKKGCLLRVNSSNSCI